MAKHLNKIFRGLVVAVAAGGAVGLIQDSAFAQALTDPTRPPAVMQTDEKSAGTQNESTTPMLQSILVSPVRKQAIINGKALTVGERVGQAKIVQITENAVVLRTGNNVQTLKLFPGIEKQSNSNFDSGNRRQ